MLHRVQDSISKIEGNDAAKPRDISRFFQRFFMKIYLIIEEKLFWAEKTQTTDRNFVFRPVEDASHVLS